MRYTKEEGSQQNGRVGVSRYKQIVSESKRWKSGLKSGGMSECTFDCLKTRQSKHAAYLLSVISCLIVFLYYTLFRCFVLFILRVHSKSKATCVADGASIRCGKYRNKAWRGMVFNFFIEFDTIVLFSLITFNNKNYHNSYYLPYYPPLDTRTITWPQKLPRKSSIMTNTKRNHSHTLWSCTYRKM